MLVLGVAAAAVGVTAAFGSQTRAQEEVPVELVSVDAAGTAPLAASNTAPATSDDARTVAFEAAGDDSSGPRIWIRDRTDRSSRPVADERSRAPGISGDGCVVAYSTVDDDSTTLRVTDICTTDRTPDTDRPVPLSAVVDIIPNVPAVDAAANEPIVAAPALSVDGAVIVWSTGQEIRRYVQSSEPDRAYDVADFDDTTTPTPESVTGVDVDVSADGATIVFVAGPGGAPYAPTPANIHVWDHSDTTVAAVVETVSVTSSGAPGSADSLSPSVSADGSLIVFESRSVDLAAAGAAAPDIPFVAAVDHRVDPDDRTTGILVSDAARPSVSGDGLHVVYERGDAVRVLSSSDGDFAVDRAFAGLQAVAPMSRAAISATGKWLVFDATTAPTGAATEFATGTQVWAADLQSPTDTPTTSGPTPNSTVPTTTIDTGTSLPATTVPGTWVDTPPAGPIFVPRPRFSIPAPRSTRTTTRSTTERRSTLPRPGDDATLSATSIVFPSTVVDAGRRTDTVVLSNQSSRSVSLTGTTIAPPGPFSIVNDSCSGVLAAGATCVVDVQFAPVAIGTATASLVFQLADLPAVVATLDGDGSPEPTVDVVPAVAGAGQTVTVFGSGFPAGSSVQFVRQELPGSDTLAVDVDGTFAHVVVVVPNTPAGPTTWAIEAQPDQFAKSSTQLVVSTRREAAAGAALRGALTGR